MPFWTYLLQCADRHFYAGHTDDLERRMGEHQAGAAPGYTRTRLPVHLVWSQEFPSRYEALQAELRLKGWSRAKKLALIRGDWAAISALSRSPKGEGMASTSSARTELGQKSDSIFLHPHPDFRPSEPLSLEVALRRSKDRLQLRFSLRGPIQNLNVPAPASSERMDGLWQHTCFEAFVRAEGEDGYFEFNLSPSGQWAAYRFDVYRDGMEDAPAQEPPAVSIDHDQLEVSATLRLPELSGKVWQVALTAVIEEKDGTKSYWALRHPPGKPDFHHPDCFALELPPPSAS